MEGKKKKANCPYCGTAMRTVVMACDHCEVEIKGQFRETKFDQLSNEDLEFLEQYLLAGFNIKALAETSGLGYVAIRNRLDRVIANYRTFHDNEDAKRAILEQLERGELTPTEAAEALERL